jgi:aerobic carbon-monoxide dehydrogenase large subunit
MTIARGSSGRYLLSSPDHTQLFPETNMSAHGTIRVEDDQLLRGEGRFADDAKPANLAYAHFVRSPHAHARVKSVDVEQARQASKVLAALTAKDMEGVGSVSRHPPMTGRNGFKLVMPHRPVLAGEKITHIGQPIAVVIAETLAAAQDAAELVAVDYEELPAVTDARDALKPGAPQLYTDAPGNLAFDFLLPNDENNSQEVERIMKNAAKVARVEHLQQRIVIATMEPRGGTASYDPASDSYALRVCSQGSGPMHGFLSAIMGLPKEKLRVTTEEVGGAFGMKSAPYPEYPALLVAARLTKRPVHWMATRSESFLSDNQARDSAVVAELALDERGKFLALRITQICNVGAFVTPANPHLMTNNFTRCLPGMYRIPHIESAAKCLFTNTVPIGPYRGAGRPEANYVLERLVDEAARVTGIDRVRIRRRNLIPPSAIPYKTPVGTTYDSGEFDAVVEKAIELSNYAGFSKRRRESKSRKKLRGIGISCFLEHSGGTPTESASLTFPGGDNMVVGLGVQSTGQSHATVYPRLVAERLGIRPEQVKHRHGDSSMNLPGAPSVGSRSTMTAGAAVVRGIELLLEKGKKIAAMLLEASEADIEYKVGVFKVVGTDRRLSLFEVASRSADLAKRGQIAENLDTKATVDTPQTFPNGCHIAEVEIDPDTGEVIVATYTAVDDGGNIIDHTLVEGQVIGALAQGFGQALYETANYDGSGQLTTGSFLDYAMPRAHHMPPMAEIKAADHVVPATTNPLGVKGVGEAGTTGSIAAIMNAIADAIPAAAKLNMPATPEKVWRAVREAAGGN